MTVSTWNIVAEGQKKQVFQSFWHLGGWRQVFHRHFFHMFSTKVWLMFLERPRTSGNWSIQKERDAIRRLRPCQIRRK